MLAIHRSLAAAGVGHAFGGALALAWCTQQARGMVDLDLNVLEAMVAAAALDVPAVTGVLAGFLGADDQRFERRLSLAGAP